MKIVRLLRCFAKLLSCTLFFINDDPSGLIDGLRMILEMYFKDLRGAV